MEEVCPSSLLPEWQRVTNKMKAYIRSFQEAKINLNEVCFYDLVPHQFLLEFFDAKCKIIDHVFETCERPADYEFQKKLNKLLNRISKRRLDIDKTALNNRLAEVRVRDFLNKLKKIKPYVSYNQFGSKTGRLTTEPHTFPILTMDKTFRSVIKPKNGWFVEFDYNAAELRTLIALSGKKQPDTDIHEWNREQVGGESRDKVKQDFFAWLYGSTHVDGSVFEKTYQIDDVKSKYWNGYRVVNHFGREIEADEHHALNYIVQSTTSDLVLRQVLTVSDFLDTMKSEIAMIIHDSMIIDLDYSERHKIIEIAKIFSDTELGKFKTSVRVGKDLVNMKEIEL